MCMYYKTLLITADVTFSAASLLAAMDQTADPCEDFFQYACGTYNKAHVIPEDRSSISTFEVLADQLQITIKGYVKNQRHPDRLELPGSNSIRSTLVSQVQTSKLD